MPIAAIPIAPAELLGGVEHARGRADLVVLDAREHEIEQRREQHAHPGAGRELGPGDLPDRHVGARGADDGEHPEHARPA